MTKFLPHPQERVTGPFHVTVNGVRTTLRTGTSFTDTAALLAALDEAGIVYTAVPLTALTGTASGRIRIPGTGSSQFISLGGRVQNLALNTWFTPGTGVTEALDHAGIAYDTEYTDQTPDAFTFTDVTGVTTGSTQTSNTITVAGLDAGVSVAVTVTGGTYSKNGGAYGSTAGTAVNGDTFAVRQTASASAATAVNTVLTIGGVSDTFTSTTTASLTPGPELWPQPAFNASTGLTNVHCSVTGGQLVGDGSETVGTSTATLAGGSINAGDQFQYSFDAVGPNTIQLQIGGQAVNTSSATGTYSGTFTSTSPTNQNLVIRFADNFAGDKADNVSVKKLS